MEKKKKSKALYICLCIIMAILLFLAAGFYNELEVTNYTYASKQLPPEFDGFKIVLISDLHCSVFGENQEQLIQAVKDANPDMIALTGDILDSKHTQLVGIEPLLKGIQNVAPAYAVSGNHELAVPDLHNQLLNLYKTYGVTNLDDQSTIIERNGSIIQLHGLKWYWDITQTLPVSDTSVFSILLFHGTNGFDIVKNYHYNLVLTGHTHGGIIRLPFLGGIIGNAGEFFPKYDSGLFTENDSTMISSRGLGEAPPVPRFYNRPELICITLTTKN